MRSRELAENPDPVARQEPDVFTGGGQMGALMRQVDWPSTPLGPVQTWSKTLRPALSICIGSSFPIAIYWGPSLALLYNDAWRPILGEKHPWALGRAASEVWPEIWNTIGPMFQQVMTTGEATYSEDSLLLMHRHGYTEECYFNFSFSPIRGEGGRVEGVFNAVMETTYRVLAERRSLVLRELGERIALASTTQDVARLAVESLAKAAADAPFCLLYVVEGDSAQARLVASSGVEAGSAFAPSVIATGNEDGASWPLSRAHDSRRVEVVDNLGSRFPVPLRAGPWPEPVSFALIAPITMPSGERPSAFLVIGANPRRAVDQQYVQFLETAASQLAASFASVRRREELAEIDRAKTTFFSNVSHEFRTPLTLMLGPTEEALKSTSPRLEGEDLALLHRNELRLLKLVNTLLDFSRIEAGRMEAAFEPTDLSALTADLASSFRSAVEKAGLTLVVDCPPLSGSFHIDRDMWEKIVLNLLSNAFKFTFDGTISVRLRQVHGGAELEVADTGIGIGEARLAAHLRTLSSRRGRPFTQPRRILASVSRWSRSSSGFMVARFACRASKELEPLSSCASSQGPSIFPRTGCCPRGSSSAPPSEPGRTFRRPCAGFPRPPPMRGRHPWWPRTRRADRASASSSWTTTRTCATTSHVFSASAGTSKRRTTGEPRSKA